MILTVNSQTLATELRLLNKIVPAKPTIPILGYALLTASEGLALEGTDMSVGLRTSCQAHVQEPGCTALPVAKLLQLLEQFPEGDVRIEQKGHHVMISSGSFRSRLQTMSAEDVQPLPEISGELSQVHLRPLIERTRYAISQKTTKFTLDGALLSLNQVAAMVATDGKRLSVATSTYQGAEMRETIPSKTLEALLDFEGVVECSSTERHLFFRADHRLLISRKIDSVFPAFERIIPTENDKQVGINRVQLAAALRRIGVISESSFATYLLVEPEMMTLTSSSAEIGDAFEQLPIRYQGSSIKVCVNWQFLLDFLEAAEGHEVLLSLKDGNSPMLLNDGTSFMNVIMLMRE